MEENKSKNGIGVTILLIIGIIVIALLCTLVYILQSNNNKKLATDSDNNEKIINELRTEITNLKNELENKNMTSDEKYAIFLKNLKNKVKSLKGPSNIWGNYTFSLLDKGSYSVELNSSCKLSISFTDKDLEKEFGTASLATDVVAFYSIYVGNDGGQYLYFIKSDGTLWKADIDELAWGGKNINIEQIKEYKNIVSIMQIYDAVEEDYPGSMNALFIDIDGNTYSNNK